MIEMDEVRRLLLASFPEADLEIVDLTGTKDHYQARIVASAFAGKSLVSRHQLV